MLEARYVIHNSWVVSYRQVNLLSALAEACFIQAQTRAILHFAPSCKKEATNAAAKFDDNLPTTRRILSNPSSKMI